MKKIKIFSTLLILSLFLIFGTVLKSEAGIAENVIGWLWGGSESPQDSLNGSRNGNETGAGWISMNSRDCDNDNDGKINVPACGPVGSSIANYGVNIPLSDGIITGTAWSENLGWISFDASNLAGCPVGPCNARRVGNNLVGWARVLAIKKDMEKMPANSGGWSGFIQLDNPTAPSFGVKIDPATGNLSGYGWNGEESGPAGVYAQGLGAIDFSKAKIDLPKYLKVCRNTCSDNDLTPLAISGGGPGELTMMINSYNNLRVCFGINTKCNDEDVTPDANKVIFHDPVRVIDNSAMNGNDWRVTSSANVGSANARTSRNTDGKHYQVEMKINVYCPADPSCADDTCLEKDCTDICGNKYPGTKDCSWKEILPQ